MLTARHVVEGAQQAVVEIDGVTAAATVFAVDPNGRDAAVLDVPGLRDRAGAAVARTVRASGAVRLLGHPYGTALTEVRGDIVGELDAGPLALDGGRVLTLDLRVDEGMSGGPVIDASGALAGIAIGYEANTRTGIAVPVDDLGSLLEGDGLTPVAGAAC